MPKTPVPGLQEIAALALALCSLLLAFAAAGGGPVASDLIKNPLAPDELVSTLATVAAGIVIALCFGRSLPRPGSTDRGNTIAVAVRRASLAAGATFERTDSILRRWPVAGIALLVLAALFAWAMMAAR
jgi:hypothetical protein